MVEREIIFENELNKKEPNIWERLGAADPTNTVYLGIKFNEVSSQLALSGYSRSPILNPT